MHIFLTNDDGINAPGLRALCAAFSAKGHRVTVVAPQTEQSGVSGSLHLHQPLRVHAVRDGNFSGLAVEGTPVDCVKLGLTTLLDERPDLVVSGLNAGCNMGTDIYYSGTVGAAMEGALQGFPAIAFSRPVPEVEPAERCARHAADLLDLLEVQSLPYGHMLNVNYPRRPMAEVRGIRVCRMTPLGWAGTYQRREDPSGRPYWWIDGYLNRETGGDDTDIGTLRQGFVAVTPLQLDRTDYSWIERMQQQVSRNNDE